MTATELNGVVDLGQEEVERIDGGNYVAIAGFLLGCFKVGFDFGYKTLGPALFGDE
jgi:hypothetical protein